MAAAVGGNPREIRIHILNLDVIGVLEEGIRRGLPRNDGGAQCALDKAGNEVASETVWRVLEAFAWTEVDSEVGEWTLLDAAAARTVREGAGRL